MAKHLGIKTNYITGQYCYVLVRVARHRESGRMRPVGDDVELEEEVARGTNDVIPGDEASVSHFVKSFGSHYVVSYTTGNSLYQVLLLLLLFPEGSSSRAEDVCISRTVSISKKN